MNILMMTNTYLPHVGGVAQSVHRFSDAFHRGGHRVMVIAPAFSGDDDVDQSLPFEVVRVPAIQKFNGSDFSVRLPLTGFLSSALDRFKPEMIHSHHPFLLGETALRVASWRSLPLVFTHHTRYEDYTHYVPADSDVMKQFVISLSTEYANLCDHIIAPSESIETMIHRRGVKKPVTVVPTGFDRETFAEGDGRRIREELGIATDDLIVGHLGRLAPEKNLDFLSKAVARFMSENPGSHFLVVGGGPSQDQIRAIMAEADISREHVHLTGPLSGRKLIDAYHAMDLFVFTSKSETQGMVLAEAMAAGIPVVALDAPGVREVVQDQENGRLLGHENEELFARAMADVVSDEGRISEYRDAAVKNSNKFAIENCADRLLTVYRQLAGNGRRYEGDRLSGTFDSVLNSIETEWSLLSTKAIAAVNAFQQKKGAKPDAQKHP